MDIGNGQATDVPNDSGIFRKLSNDTAVNLQFKDMQYEVEEGEQSAKIILNSVSGEFRAGELSAIIGPSGSGKTTLLNLLAGYRIKPNSGKTSINGRLLNGTKFRKISRYVLQEDYISPHFTVKETMMMASNFKLGPRYTKEQRQTVVDELLQFFHLQESANTRISDVSGGERKRVCVALELLNNPAVLFLDEPTTGLDESSAFQCIMLLKQLAIAGHTVICSIHSPSYRLMEMFDHVYTLAEGQCVYQGEVRQIVPYLEHFGLNCPTTYNPADFLIEAAAHAYDNIHKAMVHQTDNGKIIKWLPFSDVSSSPTPSPKTVQSSAKCIRDVQRNSEFGGGGQISWWSEYMWILQRTIKQIWRNQTNLKIRIFVHIALSTLIGYSYLGVGRNASIGLYNYHMILVVIVLAVFVAMSPVVASVGLEIKYLQREYFNQWYRLSSYFMALLTSQLLMLIVMSTISSALIYLLSGQPLQLFRFVLFTVIILLTAMVASSFGLCLGSRLNLVNALFLCPAFMGVFIMLANYATERPYLSIIEKLVMYSSCLRYSVEGILAALFLYNRPNMVCPPNEMFCLMSRPRYLLKLVGSENIDYSRSAACLVGFYLVFSVLAFVNFRWRLLGKRITHHQFTYVLTKYLCLKKCKGK